MCFEQEPGLDSAIGNQPRASPRWPQISENCRGASLVLQPWGLLSWVGPFGAHSPWISDCKHIISMSRPARAGPSSHPTPNSVIHSSIHPGSVSHPGWLNGLLRRGLQEGEKGGLMLRSKHTLHVPGQARVYKVFTVEAETTVLMS